MLSKFLVYLRYELNRTELTVEAYKRDISQFSEWIYPGNPEKVDFSTVTASDIRTWLSSLAKRGESPRTLRRKIISLRSLFKWMLKTGAIKTSPLQNVPLPKIPKPLPDLIKPYEIEEAIKNISVLETEENPEAILKNIILEVFYSLGIRRAELIGLNDEDISYSKGEIKVTGKRSKQRIVPVPQKLLDKIKKWQEFRDKNQQKKDTGSPLFTIKGKRVTASQVYRVVTQSLSISTARKKGPHALRHSFASGMLNGGAEMDSVREFLGHASLATTQIYTHISLNEIKKAYSSAHPRSGGNKK